MPNFNSPIVHRCTLYRAHHARLKVYLVPRTPWPAEGVTYTTYAMAGRRCTLYRVRHGQPKMYLVPHTPWPAEDPRPCVQQNFFPTNYLHGQITKLFGRQIFPPYGVLMIRIQIPWPLPQHISVCMHAYRDTGFNTIYITFAYFAKL